MSDECEESKIPYCNIGTTGHLIEQVVELVGAAPGTDRSGQFEPAVSGVVLAFTRTRQVGSKSPSVRPPLRNSVGVLLSPINSRNGAAASDPNSRSTNSPTRRAVASDWNRRALVRRRPRNFGSRCPACFNAVSAWEKERRNACCSVRPQ